MQQRGQLNEVIEDALRLLAYGLRSGGVAVERNLAEDLPPVAGDLDELTQVFTNLLVRAEQALSGTEAEGVGTRIGPSVCHGIIQAQGGTVDVTSSLGGTASGCRWTCRPCKPGRDASWWSTTRPMSPT